MTLHVAINISQLSLAWHCCKLHLLAEYVAVARCWLLRCNIAEHHAARTAQSCITSGILGSHDSPQGRLHRQQRCGRFRGRCRRGSAGLQASHFAVLPAGHASDRQGMHHCVHAPRRQPLAQAYSRCRHLGQVTSVRAEPAVLQGACAALREAMLSLWCSSMPAGSTGCTPRASRIST